MTIDELPRYISNAAALKAGLKPGEYFRWGKNIYRAEAVEKEFRVSTSVDKLNAMSLLQTITGLSIGPPVTPPGVVRSDIFTPGNSYYLSSINFNSTYGLNPGDTVLLPAGTYGPIEIGQATGITFKNSGGVVNVPYINIYGMAKDCSVIGNGHVGTTYGFNFTSPTNFGLGLRCTGTFEMAWFKSVGQNMGIQLLGNSGFSYAVNQQNMNLHDFWIEGTTNEAVYLGYHIVGGIYQNTIIQRGKFYNIGLDAIQCRNGYFEVLDNYCDGVGFGGDSSNGTFISIGGNTNGSKIQRNQGINIATNGVFINGWGTHEVSCNNVECGASGIWTKNYEYTQDLQNVGYQTINEHDNTIVAGNGIAFEHYYRTAGEAGVSGANKIVTATATNNKTAGGNNIQSGVIWTNTNNNNSVVPSCS